MYINNYGRKLINIMNKCHTVIMNGRMTGDLAGKLTSHSYNGSSCIDYAIVSYGDLGFVNQISIKYLF